MTQENWPNPERKLKTFGLERSYHKNILRLYMFVDSEGHDGAERREKVTTGFIPLDSASLDGKQQLSFQRSLTKVHTPPVASVTMFSLGHVWKNATSPVS